MKDQENHIDLIDKYLKNELSEEELLQFEGKIIEDESFGQLLHEMNMLVEGIKTSASKTTLDEKLGKLAAYAEEGDENQHNTNIQAKNTDTRLIGISSYFRKYRLPIAAVITLLITSIFTLINIGNGPDETDLFEKHFSAYEYMGPHANTRGEKETVTDQALAVYYYERKDYQESNDYFEKVLIEDPDNVTALFYSGNALLAMGEHPEASERFRKVISLNRGLDVQAKWYLALCLFRSGDTSSMKPLLKEIAESNTTYSQRANELLKALP